MTAMNSGFQILPLREYALVGLHLRSCFGPLKAIALKLANQVVENQRIGAFATILRQHAYQQQVDGVGIVPFQRFQQFPPAKRQESAIASALECTGERGECYTKSYHLIAIHNTCNQVQVGNLDVIVHQLVYLML